MSITKEIDQVAQGVADHIKQIKGEMTREEVEQKIYEFHNEQ